MAITFRAGTDFLTLEQEELQSVERALARLLGEGGQLRIDPYGRAVRSSHEIRQFAEELAALRTAYRTARVAELVRERGIRARSAALVEQAVAPLLAKDRDLAVLDRLAAALDQVAASGASPLLIEGD